MSILIDENTRVLVQGITGRRGSFNTQQMLAFGTNIVAGVTPGKGGQEVCGVPVYNSVKEACRKHMPDWSIMFVPALFAKKAAFEALENGLNLVIITEEIPIHDTLAIIQKAQEKRVHLIGPNCPGLASAGSCTNAMSARSGFKCKIGIIPNDLFAVGNVGIVSRSGTLTHEVISQLTQHGIGQTTVVGIGGDRVVGSSFIDILQLFNKDKQTKKVVLIGEIGGNQEEMAAAWIAKHMKKPVVSYIAGRTAPPEKRMGHAGAIIYGKAGTAESKMKALKEAGVQVARTINEVITLVK